jgi:hypothetical protein
MIWFSAGKIHIFVTPFSYSSLLTKGQKSESVEVQGRLQGKFFMSVSSPSNSAAKLSFIGKQTFAS